MLPVISTVAAAWVGERTTMTRLVVAGAAVLCAIAAAHPRGAVRATLAVGAVCSVASFARSHVEWSTVSRALPAEVRGEAVIVGDPDPVGRATRVVFEVDGTRYESWLYGRLARKVARLESGRHVVVRGAVTRADGGRDKRLVLRHILGRLDVEDVDTESTGPGQSRADLAANRLRASMRRGAELLGAPFEDLFAGLVYGDDRTQPADMVERFRESGLAHLTAVSGQNVAFVLTVLGPVLGSLRRWWRLAATVSVLAWFVLLTRAEPSVLRAGTMAAVAAVGFAVGGRHRTVDVLAVSTVLLIVVDPFLVWSVGWWLSVGGTLGLVVVSPLLSAWCDVQWSRRGWDPPGVIVRALVTTLSAQCGVAPVVVAVFGWPNALSTACNLLAVPVAGVVMLTGIPASIVAGLLPSTLGGLAMWPVGVMVRWVDAVAVAGAHLHPPVAVDMVVTVVVWLGVMSAALAAAVGARSRRRVTTLGDGRVPLPRIR